MRRPPYISLLRCCQCVFYHITKLIIEQWGPSGETCGPELTGETELEPSPAPSKPVSVKRSSKRRSGTDTVTSPSPPAYFTRNIPFYDFLGEEGLERIEAQADWLLQEIGIEFRDDAPALAIWRNAGADVQGERVRMPAGMARDLCATAPAEFVQQARNPSHSVCIGGRHGVFAPAYGSPFVRCAEKGRRYGTLEDFENFVKLAYLSPWLHHSGGTVCEPCDIPVSQRHLDMVYAHMRYSDKPFLGSITEKNRAEESLEMCRILFGTAFMDQECVVMGNINTNSPLVIDKVASEAIATYAGANQGSVVVPFILGGAMGPVTTAAGIAQSLAEAMSCIGFAQLVRPGAPVVFGSFLSSMSLRSGAPTFGMPEPVMSNYVLGALARRLGVPSRFGGAVTASKLPDAQAAYESADSLHSTVMGGANFILHSAGWLESALVMSYEKFIMDVDRLGAMQKLLGGMSVDDNALASDAYREVSPGDHFLGCGHTMANYRDAFYEATMSDSESFEQWHEQGSEDSVDRAHRRWRQLLADYEAPHLDQARDEELREYIDRKKASRADAWY
ncbi:MAG: trimethylamine methyltransferase family protein [Sulfitobacter sp.]|nr:trimethylamine methyltransferase family protein [Sulfitobacter sp.]